MALSVFIEITDSLICQFFCFAQDGSRFFVCFADDTFLAFIQFFLFGVKETMEAYGETDSEEKELLKGLLYSAAHLIYMHARLEAHREKLDTQM